MYRLHCRGATAVLCIRCAVIEFEFLLPMQFLDGLVLMFHQSCMKLTLGTKLTLGFPRNEVSMRLELDGT